MRLVFRESLYELDRYPEDVERMYRALEDLGYTADHFDIVRAWRAHSECMAAGWRSIDRMTDGMIAAALLTFLERVEEEGEPIE